MLSQITAITGLNLKSIPERWASSPLSLSPAGVDMKV